MRELATILQNVGFLAYALPILWCTTLLIRPGKEVKTLRRFRRVGPLLGFALGACILGTLAGIWIDHSAFELRWQTDQDRLESAMYITFFAVWISNIKLEIWSLEGVRKIDNDPAADPTDSAAFAGAVATVRRHLNLHSVGILSVLALSLGF